MNTKHTSTDIKGFFFKRVNVSELLDLYKKGYQLDCFEIILTLKKDDVKNLNKKDKKTLKEIINNESLKKSLKLELEYSDIKDLLILKKFFRKNRLNENDEKKIFIDIVENSGKVSEKEFLKLLKIIKKEFLKNQLKYHERTTYIINSISDLKKLNILVEYTQLNFFDPLYRIAKFFSGEINRLSGSYLSSLINITKELDDKKEKMLLERLKEIKEFDLSEAQKLKVPYKFYMISEVLRKALEKVEYVEIDLNLKNIDDLLKFRNLIKNQKNIKINLQGFDFEIKKINVRTFEFWLYDRLYNSNKKDQLKYLKTEMKKNFINSKDYYDNNEIKLIIKSKFFNQNFDPVTEQKLLKKIIDIVFSENKNISKTLVINNFVNYINSSPILSIIKKHENYVYSLIKEKTNENLLIKELSCQLSEKEDKEFNLYKKLAEFENFSYISFSDLRKAAEFSKVSIQELISNMNNNLFKKISYSIFSDQEIDFFLFFEQIKRNHILNKKEFLKAYYFIRENQNFREQLFKLLKKVLAKKPDHKIKEFLLKEDIIQIISKKNYKKKKIL